MSSFGVFAGLLLLGAIVAQEPARRPLVGAVRSADGPIGGAEVTLLGIPSDFEVAVDEPDVVQVRADVRGYFAARVLAGVPYLGFASGGEGAGEVVARSPVQGWFGAGATVAFECAMVAARTPVRVLGGAAWGAHGPLQLLARPGMEPGVVLPFAMALATDAAASGRWPDLPSGALELRAADGLPLAWLEVSPQPAGVDLRVRPPLPLECRVADESGAPVAGAEVRWRGDSFFDGGIDGIQTLRSRRQWPLARTDERGVARVELPIEDPFVAGTSVDLMLEARAAGREPRVSGFLGGKCYRDDHVVARGDARVVSFVLPQAAAVRGQVRHAGAASAAWSRARLQMVGKLFSGPRIYQHDPRADDTDIAADGTFAFASLPQDLHSTRLWLYPKNGGPAVSTMVAAGRALDLVVDVAALAGLQLAVLDDRRGPAAGQVFYLRLESVDRGVTPAPTQRCCTDAAGRAEVPLWPGTWFLFAANGRAGGWQRVTLRAGERQACELALEPWPVARGVLLDAAGEPVAGAVAELREVSVTKRADVDPAARSVLRALAPRLVQAMRTGTDGSFALPYPPGECLQLRVQLRAGDRCSDPITLDGEYRTLRLRTP